MDLPDNPQLDKAVLNRLTAEYGETARANFTLEILYSALKKEYEVVLGIKEALLEANTRLKAENEELRAARAPRRVAGKSREESS